MTLQGKGFFTSHLSECEGGDPASILAAALDAGLSHVIVKIADGEKALGIDGSGIDLTATAVQALRLAGIAVWGWQTIHGKNPMAEAAIAIARMQTLGLDGYVVNPEEQYQHAGMANSAHQFMAEVRSALTIPIALSSHRFPDYHPDMSWSTFLEFCDLHMPQVTWESAHNAGAQMRESKRQCDALPNARPYISTGGVYPSSGWSPTTEDINDFLNTARAIGLPAVNFFDWDTCRQKLPLLWTTIADFAWPVSASTSKQVISPIFLRDAFLVRFLSALNSRQAVQACALYDPAAIQVWADQTLPGASAIQTGFAAFFESVPAGTIFTIDQAQSEADLRHLSWKAGSLTGKSTFVLKNGKIILDYTFIT